jgi:type I restriction enzyme S subunit
MNNFSRYDSYKDSGVDWLGNIPEHWEAVSLGSIMELKSDKNHPDFEVLSVYREFGVIPKDSRDDNHNATSLDTTTYKAVEKGDLVVNKMKAWQGSMGISLYKGIVSPAYITCKITSKKVYSEFLHQLLRCTSYIGEYNRISYGVRIGQWDMHYEDFKRVTVLLPLISEQIAIAEFLDRKSAQIEQAIAQKERLIELLKERRQILIHNAVTRGLNPKVKLKHSGVDWIGEIPEHWDLRKLKFLGKIKYGLGQPPKEKENGLPLIRATNVERGKIVENGLIFVDPEDIPWERNPELKENDIIVVRSGAYTADSAIIPKRYAGAIVGYDMVFTPKQINPRFLSFALLSKYILFDQLYLLRMRAAQPHLNAEELGETLILFPPETEQLAISEHIENISAKIETAISCKQKEIEKLKEYKAVLINSAVTGKIKVCGNSQNAEVKSNHAKSNE